MKKYTIFFYLVLILFISCESKDDFTQAMTICPSDGLLEAITNTDGREIFIYEDGKLYIEQNGICNFEVQYFDPNFLETSYLTNDDGRFLITDENDLFPTKNKYTEGFENASIFTDLFISSLNDTDLYWIKFTLQSPAAPEVNDYVQLSHCILDGTCAFIDNKIELVNDPINSTNMVLKLTCVPPSVNMVTAKSSISSTLNFHQKTSEVWFEASYYIESGLPFSIVDFENSYFLEHPGPRVVINNNKLEVENKFGEKLYFSNYTDIEIPLGQWFTLKVHFKYSNENDGIIELWQDGVQIISTTGINLPTSNSIQNTLEVGVTASSIGCVLLFDDMRISDTPF